MIVLIYVFTLGYHGFVVTCIAKVYGWPFAFVCAAIYWAVQWGASKVITE